MKRRRLQAVEWRLLLALWLCVAGTAAAFVALLVADIQAGDWRYGSITQLWGIGLSVAACCFSLWASHRALKANWERDEINMFNVAQIVEFDRRIAAADIDGLEARLDRERGAGSAGRLPNEPATARDAGPAGAAGKE